VEAFSAAELIELTLIANELLDAQFEYWLSISFAAVVATFIGGDYLSRKMRYVLVVLYLLASTLLIFKYLSVLGWTTNISTLSAEVTPGILETPLGLPTFFVRLTLFFGGLVTTVWFILIARREDDA
jgi:hypothetical protein